jgi:hypothetical protein
MHNRIAMHSSGTNRGIWWLLVIGPLLVGAITTLLWLALNGETYRSRALLAVDVNMASHILHRDVLERTAQRLAAAGERTFTADELARRLSIVPEGDRRTAFYFTGDTAAEARAIGETALDELLESTKPAQERRELLERDLREKQEMLLSHARMTGLTERLLPPDWRRARNPDEPEEITSDYLDNDNDILAGYARGLIIHLLRQSIDKVLQFQKQVVSRAAQIRGIGIERILEPPDLPEAPRSALRDSLVHGLLAGALCFLVLGAYVTATRGGLGGITRKRSDMKSMATP